MLKLPAILPSSNSTINTDRPLSVKLDTNSYEQWRATIHRELEEDLQRQVRELLEETERQERLAKLEREKLRVAQSSSSSKQVESGDIWNEIDRRNEYVLNPLISKNSSKVPKHFSIYHHQFSNNSNKSFYFDSYHSNRSRRRSSTRTEDQIYLNPSIYLNNYINKQSLVTSFSNDPSFVFGNSIIRSNKADILNIFDQQLRTGDNGTTYVNKYGVIIDENGPFWPENYQILHPTPKLLSREPTPKEFYLSPSMSNTTNQQTYANQPAIYKYTETLKRSVIVYDMDKSARRQQIKSNDNEHSCPQLIFESRFEGGNLRQVKRVGQFEYELILRPDLYTRRHIQWYYFRVQNMIANTTYRFRIINLMKKTSLYNNGMQILLFSELDAKREYRGWHRAGHHINYSEYKPRSHNSLLERDINYFELDFQLEFSHSGDTCYIAHCYPYTFSDLKNDLEYLSATRPREIFRREVLCESQAGNACFIITVTDESVPINKKKFVFITARIHPGETNSSYMMRGLLEFITSNDKIAQKLRSQLVFKIIPMLNPDGVIVGNYRCSLTGKDMNRNFRHPRRQTFPIIYHMKELIQNLQREQREILAFCDLHGHSRKSNVFAYGCDGCDGPEPDMKSFVNARVLPFIMSKTAPDMFAFDYCKFHIHRCKESTGRVVMWKEMLIKNSFTLEASFAGSSIVERPCHFNIQDYENFGQCICQSLRQYLDILSDSTRLDSIFMDITKSVIQKLDKDKIPPGLLSSLYSEKEQSNQSLRPINSVSSCLQILSQCHETIVEQDASSSSDSDSDPEGGELPDTTSPKDGQGRKKKFKKKRSEKNNEEQQAKQSRKRQVNRAKSVRISSKSAKYEFNNSHQIPLSYPITTTIDINSQMKFTLPPDQMEKPARVLPERGVLFTSKYANRNGHGLPIFTTERALERKHQKRSDSFTQDVNGDRQMTDEYETDTEILSNLKISPQLTIEPNSLDIVSTKPARPQNDNSTIIDQSIAAKRAPSLVSLPNNQLSIEQAMNHPSFSPTPMFKGLARRRIQHLHRLRQQQNTRNDLDQISDMSPPIITMPHLMDFTRRLSRSSSNNENEMTIIDIQTDYNPLRSLVRNETPISRTRMPMVNNNNNGNSKRVFPQKLNNLMIQEPLSSIESIIKERAIRMAQESTYHQSNTSQRSTQIFKKQIYLPFDKK